LTIWRMIEVQSGERKLERRTTPAEDADQSVLEFCERA